MVQKKRLNNRSPSFQVPVIPRAPRSSRKRVQDSRNTCAIELLASLAGKLLQETESSASNTSSDESDQLGIRKDAIQFPVEGENKPLKSEEQGSCADGAFVSDQSSENSQQKDSFDCSSVFTGSASSEKSTISKSESFGGGALKSEGLVAFDESNAMELDRNDDDEKFTRFNRFSSAKANKTYKHSHHIVDRRIRKLLGSKSDGVRKVSSQKRRAFYGRDRYHRDFLNKRRKLIDGSCTMTTSDGVLSSESDSSSLQMGGNGVKFSIKSFKIPELFIDVPETATVGSLKRTIMEAVTSVFGRGLRVGVLLQGKKIRDDSRTLLQAGISCKENLDTLGFMLEPNLTQPSPPTTTSIAADEDSPQQLIGNLDKPASDSATDPANNVDNGDELIVSSTTDIVPDTHPSESKAIVPVPETNLEPLAIVPANPKNKRSSELSQRRIRRPFSVSEVEALVQAVEELGTGRWRDVKLRAFENADHRTYVDLKDKWKTLVHTASIAPQQRRGEPVPQDLLDRVTAAHTYWSDHQSKENRKVNVTVQSPLNITDDGPAALPAIGLESSD